MATGEKIAGMETDRVSVERGCEVNLFEKCMQLGGDLLAASVP